MLNRVLLAIAVLQWRRDLRKQGIVTGNFDADSGKVAW